MKQEIRKQIEQVIKKLYPNVRADFSVDFAPENIDADVASNVAMVLAKKVGKKPMEVAVELANELGAAAVAPGFLNFKVGAEELAKNLEHINKLKEKYGQAKIGKKKLAIVEYFQLNVAKPPHVGHLRSAVIGDSLKRILKFAGYKAVSDTHIGDWGTQFGIMLWAIKNSGHQVDLTDLAELNKLYIQANKAIEDSPEILEQAKGEFVLLEKGEKESRKYWKQMVKTSTHALHAVQKLLALEKFDYELGESFYEDEMRVILGRLEEKKLLSTGETGERYVDLEQHGLGRLICLKSDGGTTYELRDLATVAYRYDVLAQKEKAELAWNLYVVDARQAHDFKQVFKTMDMLGYDVSKSKHVAFGFMSLPEGPISTRKGNIVSLEKLVEEAKTRAEKIIEEKNPELNNKERVAEQVALAAIKYFDLKHNRQSDIVFQWDDVLAFEGNTGPYLQYTHVRLKSILRKANHNAPFPPSYLKRGEGELLPEEVAVMRKLGQFEDAVVDAAGDFLPNILANYLYSLAEKINLFYQKVPVLQEADDAKKQNRLALVAASAQVLENGLGLLGIEAPEEM